MKLKALISKTVLSVFLYIIGIGMVLPVFWMVSSSLKFEADVFKMPMEWIPRTVTLLNYT